MTTLYRLSGGDSFIHRLDPRTKLVFVLSYLIATLLSAAPWWMFVGIVAILWIFARIPPIQYAGFLRFLAIIFGAILLVQTFFVHGGPFYFEIDLAVITLSASEAGFRTGLAIAFRLATMGLAFMMFSMTTDPFQWGMSMYKWGLPYKVAFMFAFALRLLPLLQEEFLVIRQALESKGMGDLNSKNVVKRFRAAGIALVPVALSSLRRSKEIALAMEVRGFSYPAASGRPRTIYREIALNTWDYTLLVALPLLLVLLLVWF